MTEYKRRAMKAFRAVNPTAKERNLVAWYLDQLHGLGMKVSRATIYNWFKGRVEMPTEAWGALLAVEADAVLHLEGLIAEIGGEGDSHA